MKFGTVIHWTASITFDSFLFFLFSFCFFYRPSSTLYSRSSTSILPDYWGTFCAGVCPKSVFSFLVAAGFEPTSLSLRSGRLDRYTMEAIWLLPRQDFGWHGNSYHLATQLYILHGDIFDRWLEVQKTRGSFNM